MRFSKLSAFVLAGGASQRMGQPKQALLLKGEPMLVRQARLATSVCAAVAVLGGPRPGDGLVHLEDEWPGHGPLGGIYTGLLRTRTEYNLILGCDMPFLTSAFLRYVCRRALATGADVTVAESSRRRVEPLCGVYRRRARAAIRMSLARDENKTSRFYPRVCCHVIAWREISRAGFRPDIFTNINTPEDYDAVRKALI